MEGSADKLDTENILAPIVKKKALVIVLSQNQTKARVQDALIHGAKTMIEHRDQINDVKVPLEGSESTLHPSQRRETRKQYEEAIEWGLLGFLIQNGFDQTAAEVYYVAYAKADVQKGGFIKYKNIDEYHMTDTFKKSGIIYTDLLRTARLG